MNAAGGRFVCPRERAHVSIEVRRAEPDDDAFIVQLGSACAANSVSSLRPAPESVVALSFQRLMAFCRERPGTVELVAELDGSRAGFLILLTDVPDDVTQLDQAFVAYMAVAAPLRRRGIGGELMRVAAEEARRLGLPHLCLMVTAENAPARELYRSSGFADERILMTKRLAAVEGFAS